MPPQRYYHRTTDQDREKLVECHENGEDFVIFGHNLGIRRPTAYLIVSNFIPSN